MRCLQSWVAAVAVLAAAGAARGEEAAGTADPPQSRERTRWLVEIKRQATARGTPEETTKSQLKFDYFPEGPVSLLRLELPFPDEDTDFEGSPFNPRLGDVKVRAGMRAIPVGSLPVASFVELTFPTADPESLGSGKYQLSAGARSAFLVVEGGGEPRTHRHSFSFQAQQVVSFGGDAARKDVNQTKFELEWRLEGHRGYYGKATAKPVVDWVQDGKTGAVLELEGGRAITREWTVALMAGGLLWGKGTPGTYETRVELKASRRF
jgi:hypothetical protein